MELFQTLALIQFEAQILRFSKGIEKMMKAAQNSGTILRLNHLNGTDTGPARGVGRLVSRRPHGSLYRLCGAAADQHLD